MSSHREAPEISRDPVADSADLYAFVSPDSPSTVTIIANYVPLQQPAGGPNFYEFGDDVLYEVHIDNDGDARADITYQFRLNTVLTNTGANDLLLYNTGQIKHLSDKTWNRKQFYSLTRVDKNGSHLLAKDLACPPCNVGKNSIPDYAPLAAEAVHPLGSGGYVFAGQRADGFYVDLGSIFDLPGLLPLPRRPVGRLRQPVNPEPPSCRLTRWLRVDQGHRRCDNTCIPTLAGPTTLTPVKFYWPGRHPGRPTRAVR